MTEPGYNIGFSSRKAPRGWGSELWSAKGDCPSAVGAGWPEWRIYGILNTRFWRAEGEARAVLLTLFIQLLHTRPELEFVDQTI